jgi:serine/threonine protein kinase
MNPGDKLGPYEILSSIGEGGMGQVWKARDTRLDRIVAIKRLKGEHGARFQQEARTIAALNPPSHLSDLRCRPGLPCAGVHRRQHTSRSAAAFRSGDGGPADRLRIGDGACEGHPASRSQARQHSDDRLRSQVVGLRACEDSR